MGKTQVCFGWEFTERGFIGGELTEKNAVNCFFFFLIGPHIKGGRFKGRFEISAL
jgi:hypothetical protein